MSKEIPTTTYELPDFLVEADEMFSTDHPINKAMLHVKKLNAQCYALKLLAPFNDMPQLVGMCINMEENGYLTLIDHEQDQDADDIEDNLQGYIENLNDVLDKELLTFIMDIFEDGDINRDNVHNQVTKAYSVYCQGDDWNKVFAKRQAFLEARQLAADTDNITPQRPKTRI